MNGEEQMTNPLTHGAHSTTRNAYQKNRWRSMIETRHKFIPTNEFLSCTVSSVAITRRRFFLTSSIVIMSYFFSLGPVSYLTEYRPSGWRIWMDNDKAGLHSIVVFLRLCAHSNTIRNAGQTIRCIGLPWLGHADQFGVRISGTICGTKRHLLVVCGSFHPRIGRGSNCTLHACNVSQMDSTKWTITHGSSRLRG